MNPYVGSDGSWEGTTVCVVENDGKPVAGGAGLRYRAPADACGAPAEGWPSGLRRTPGKRVHRKVSRVRIPLPPPHLSRCYRIVFCLSLGFELPPTFPWLGTLATSPGRPERRIGPGFGALCPRISRSALLVARFKALVSRSHRCRYGKVRNEKARHVRGEGWVSGSWCGRARIRKTPARCVARPTRAEVVCRA